jgi:integrase
LVTPSQAEAQKIATAELEGMNPEIAAARATKAEEQEKLLPVIDGIHLFIGRRELDGSDSTKDQYRSLLGAIDGHGKARGKLLLALKKSKIENVQQVTTKWLQEWYQSGTWDKLALTTRTQRWNVIRALFRFLHEQGMIFTNPALPVRSARGNGYFNNVPYTDEQYSAMLKAAKDNQRVYAFIELLRWSGMDLEDAIQFRLDMIDADGVLTYHRQKTGTEAVIPLEPHMIPLLKSIPLEKGCLPKMPFRHDNAMNADHVRWYQQVKAVIAKAGITEMRYRQKDGVVTIKGPNVKALRHTFACHYLAMGYRIETVARMLGHTKISTTQEHYGPWTKGRNDAHIREVREAQAASALRNTDKNNVVSISKAAAAK